MLGRKVGLAKTPLVGVREKMSVGTATLIVAVHFDAGAESWTGEDPFHWYPIPFGVRCKISVQLYTSALFQVIALLVELVFPATLVSHFKLCRRLAKIFSTESCLSTFKSLCRVCVLS